MVRMKWDCRLSTELPSSSQLCRLWSRKGDLQRTWNRDRKTVWEKVGLSHCRHESLVTVQDKARLRRGHNDQSRRGHQCSATTLTGESWFHICTPQGIWTWVPSDGKQTGSPMDQWDMVRMMWDCRLSTHLCLLIKIFSCFPSRGECILFSEVYIKQNWTFTSWNTNSQILNMMASWQATATARLHHTQQQLLSPPPAVYKLTRALHLGSSLSSALFLRGSSDLLSVSKEGGFINPGLLLNLSLSFGCLEYSLFDCRYRILTVKCIYKRVTYQ